MPMEEPAHRSAQREATAYQHDDGQTAGAAKVVQVGAEGHAHVGCGGAPRPNRLERRGERGHDEQLPGGGGGGEDEHGVEQHLWGNGAVVSTCMHSTSMGLGSTSTMLKPARTRKKRIIKKVDAMTCGDKAPW